MKDINLELRTSMLKQDKLKEGHTKILKNKIKITKRKVCLIHMHTHLELLL